MDAPVRVLLVTCRENKRWVIPKGNPSSGHDRARRRGAGGRGGGRGARRGLPDPARQLSLPQAPRNGASLMVDVDVFPLAVNRELDHWKEQGERERRWVSLDDAAEVVEEARPRRPHPFVRPVRIQGRDQAARRDRRYSESRISPMFAWFQRLLAQDAAISSRCSRRMRSRSSARPTRWRGWSRTTPSRPTISAK